VRVVRTLTVSHIEGVPYAASLALDAALLARAAADPERGHLRTYTVAEEDAVLVGRYHVVPPRGLVPGTVALHRRRSGGRVVPFGDGFLGLSLVLPHRSALVAGHALALDPAQVINRCARGLLHGLWAMGVPAFYPGRDLVTVERRMLALVSFEITADGALLFEAVVALARDFAELPGRLDRADPGGIITAEMVPAERAVSVAAAAGRHVGAAEIAEHIAAGYADAFGLGLERTEAPPAARAAAEGAAAVADAWVLGRSATPDLDHRGAVAAQIGLLEVYFSVAAGRLGRVLLSGDFIASAAAIGRLEARLAGQPAAWAPVAACVAEEFGQPDRFVLGLGDLTLIPDAILRGLPGRHG
jgi:lipoate-protein ligase A